MIDTRKKCLHTKMKITSLEIVTHARTSGYYYCSLSLSRAMNVWFTMNRMCAKNTTHILIYMCREQATVEWSWRMDDLDCCFLPQCEAFTLAAQASDHNILTLHIHIEISRNMEKHNTLAHMLLKYLLRCLIRFSQKLTWCFDSIIN